VSKRMTSVTSQAKGDHVVFKRFSILDIGFVLTMVPLGAGSGALLFSMAYQVATGGACGF
jgi:hypothetical protein